MAVERLIYADSLLEKARHMEELDGDGIPCDVVAVSVTAIEDAQTVDAVDADKALAWLEGYAITDTEQIYTNGTVLVPLFRVKQALNDKAYNGLCEGI